jgi:hypothetical protein
MLRCVQFLKIAGIGNVWARLNRSKKEIVRRCMYGCYFSQLHLASSVSIFSHIFLLNLILTLYVCALEFQ